MTLEVSVPDTLPSIRADRNQLQQVLINLLMNAFEAARPTGAVRVMARSVTRGVRPGVEITVSDNGAGIPAAILPRIFEPFFSTKPPGEGTGLGLPICPDIVKSLDGEIRVENTPGSGNHVRRVAPRGHGGVAMTPHVLVVDNDREMLKILQKHLESDGFRVTSISRGPEAAAVLGRDEFDVILTDLVMDDVDGLALIAEAQRVQPAGRVILMTAYASLETAIAAMRHGAYDYLCKPFKKSRSRCAACGETRKATRSATSWGRAGRPIGMPPSDIIKPLRGLVVSAFAFCQLGYQPHGRLGLDPAGRNPDYADALRAHFLGQGLAVVRERGLRRGIRDGDVG